MLGERVACWASVPDAPADADSGYPVLHLLHGRGSGYAHTLRLLERIRAAEAAGRVPPHVVTGIDAPWSDRAGWYADSVHPRGRPVATALLDDVLPALEAALPVRADRRTRAVGGWSMGAAGALRLALLRPRAFSRVLALSPAVYEALPPPGSNIRVFGAFGDATTAFDEARWRRVNHAVLIAARDRRWPLRVAVAVGDAEVPGLREARALHRALADRGADSGLRVLPGGHDWTVWRPGCDWAWPWLWRTGCGDSPPMKNSD
ncbi:alpha/beta hydrolase [Streptantibioticus silvisoli]|uniref:Alpha/beta hydrolase-fold protein n=1 Tax=Streptantibioticus silvisoli TaxID=2705255 RepID=A0ABT6VWS2_9ACTN|nr:alpha/beta hydrolase-fold protein [Streptantibioticus silvisoli]MDI5961716.1 alpha/beta hydrolase-fold protein [Streptantibioticus silvisoli]